MATNVCGCGRTIFEIVNSVKAIQDIDKALAKEAEPPPEFLMQSIKGAKKALHGNFGMWLESLHTECGMSKEIVEKVWAESKTDMDSVLNTLREELIKCAGMVY